MSSLYPSIQEPTADVASLLVTVRQLKEAVELLTGQRGDADETDVGLRTRRLEAVLDNADTQIRASIASSERASVSRDEALAERASEIEAEIVDARSGQTNLAARITQVDTARVNGDNALATSINTVAAEVTGARGGQADLSARITQVDTARVNGDNALTTSINTLSSTVNDPTTGLAATRATATSAASTAASASSAASSITSEVNAVLGGSTANALLRVNSSAGSGATFSLVEFLARQTTGDTARQAGLRIGANNTTGFVEITAGQFFLSDPGWNGGARGNLLTWNGAQFVFGPPILFNSQVTFGAGVVGTTAIADGAVTASADSTVAGGLSATVNMSVRANSRVLIFASTGVGNIGTNMTTSFSVTTSQHGSLGGETLPSFNTVGPTNFSVPTIFTASAIATSTGTITITAQRGTGNARVSLQVVELAK